MANIKSKITKQANRINYSATGISRKVADLKAAYQTGSEAAKAKWHTFSQSKFAQGAKKQASKAWSKARAFMGDRKVEFLAAYAAVKAVRDSRKTDMYAEWLRNNGYDVTKQSSTKVEQDVALTTDSDAKKPSSDGFENADLMKSDDVKFVMFTNDRNTMVTFTEPSPSVGSDSRVVINKDKVQYPAKINDKCILVDNDTYNKYRDACEASVAKVLAAQADKPFVITEDAVKDTYAKAADFLPAPVTETVVDKVAQMKSDRDKNVKESMLALKTIFDKFDYENASADTYKTFFEDLSRAEQFMKSSQKNYVSAMEERSKSSEGREVPEDIQQIVESAENNGSDYDESLSL